MATFNSGNGRLRGAPSEADVARVQYLISVTDGAVTTSLAAFSIEVVATASGSATLSWLAPAQNSDGSPLTDLASYRVYFGDVCRRLPQLADRQGLWRREPMVDQLTPATWYFVITAVDSGRAESGYSNVASKSVL